MENYSEKDKKYIWHPFTQGFTDAPPIHIESASGSKLYSDDGNVYIDAISSWWVNLHGHGHPVIGKAVSEQFQTIDHVLFAGFTHAGAVDFAEELLEMLPGKMSKLFYSDNGSTSVEVAIKMALQFWHNKGIKKQTIIALRNSYHGDTFGSMSVSHRGPFNLAFSEFLFDVEFIKSPAEDPEQTLEEFTNIAAKGDVAAFIYEPLIQGAGGMHMYEPATLDTLLQLCRHFDIVPIADEVMTGFGRTGKLFASSYMKATPDIICLSKGITGGVLPLAATVCTQKIYNSFLSTDRSKTFFHGHSYTGNPLSIAAARASLSILKNSLSNIKFIEDNHNDFAKKLSGIPNVENVRCRGTILAFDVITKQKTSYFNSLRDYLYEEFLLKGVLTRPLGNVVYFMPPYCIEQEELNTIYNAAVEVLESL